MTDPDNLSLWGLFLSSFISSTILPGGSEIVLAALTQHSQINPVTLIIVASVGNTLGGLSTWGLGRLTRWRWPNKSLSERHQHALERLERYGSPALLLSWLPVVGDPLCFIAGWLRIHILKAAVLILIGKACRYIVIVFIFS